MLRDVLPCCVASCSVARFLAVLRRRVFFRVEWRGRILPPGETQATPARAIPPPRETHTTPARPQHHDSSQFRHAGAVLVSPARTARHAGAVPVSHVPARPFVWVRTRELAVVTTPRGQLPLGVTRPWCHSRAAHVLAAAATNWLSSSTRPGAPSPWPRPPREAGRPASDRLSTGREPVRRGVHE